MGWSPETNWQPTRLMEVIGSVDTSTGAIEVVTDAGRAYIKPMGNRQGPHVLATDWVGTHLAKWFGLSTFDIAILTLKSDDVFGLPRGAKAIPGPAFAARAIAGSPWDKSGVQLDLLVNPEDITRLIAFDTWTLNCDRHHHDVKVRKPNYDNVYLSSEGVTPGLRQLIAMDHGLCFIRSGEDLSRKLANIEKVKQSGVYGLFPEFRDRLRQDIIVDCATRLRQMDSATADAIVKTVPMEWDVPSEARKAWIDLIVGRAMYVAEHFESWIESVAPWFDKRGE